MMHFQKIFDKSFGAYKNEYIGIYGTGKNAKRIVENVKEYKILFFIDDQYTGNVFEGFPVVSIREAVKKISIIIIAAVPSSTRIVFNRIKDYLPNNVLVFDMYGHRLNYDLVDYPYWKQSFENLCRAIDSHDIISFDVFDTLLMRRVLYPRDIFSIIERELKEEGIDLPFLEWRLKAEESCAKVKEPSLYDIYRCLQSTHNLSDEVIEILEDKEFAWEKKAVCCRSAVLDAFEYAKKQRKSIYLLSDMYFSREQLKILLSQCGIQGYNDIFVSNEYNKTKQAGTLYLEFISSMGGESRILHIGDNVYSDIDMAEIKGISSFWVMSARDMLYYSSAKKLLDSVETLDDRILLGEILSRLFNDPFALCPSHGKIDFSDVCMMANTCFAATAMHFVSWILKNVRCAKGTILLFASRDCYFFYRVYKKICEEKDLGHAFPDAIYFFMSRKAIRGTEIRNKADISKFLDQLFWGNSKVNLKRYMEDVFQIEFPDCFDDSIENLLGSLGKSGIEKKVYELKEAILASARVKRNNYRKYLKKMGIEKYKKIILLDTQTTGTGPRLLSSLLNRPIQVFGLRFLDVNGSQLNDKIEIYSLYMDTMHFALDTKSTLLEKIYASSGKQLRGFDEDGEPLFDTSTEYDKQLLSSLQNTMMEFIENYLDSKWYTRILNDTFVLDLLDLIDAAYSTMSESTVSLFRTAEIFDARSDFNLMADIRGES